MSSLAHQRWRHRSSAGALTMVAGAELSRNFGPGFHQINLAQQLISLEINGVQIRDAEEEDMGPEAGLSGSLPFQQGQEEEAALKPT